MARTFESAAIVVVIAIAACGCGHSSRVRVSVPPAIDLKAHEIIGVIDFPCDTKDALGPVATTRFIEAARRDQGLVRFTRLGTEGEVLAAVGASRLDPAACKAIGDKFGVATIITGQLDLSEVRPNLSLFNLNSLSNIGVTADVEAGLAVQMTEAATGASLWSRSARTTRRIGGASLSMNKSVSLDVHDPDSAYAGMVHDLVYNVTPDFRRSWTWQRVEE